MRRRFLSVAIIWILFFCILFYGKETVYAIDEYVTTADFAKIFCEYFAVEPVDDNIPESEIMYADLLNKNVENWQYMVALQYPLQSKTWDGKNWSVNPDTVVTSEMVYISTAAFLRYKLVDPITAEQYLYNHMPDFDSLGYSKNSYMYLATLMQAGGGEGIESLIANKPLKEKELNDLLGILCKLSRNSAVIKETDGFTVSNMAIPDEQSYYPDGPIVNQNYILNNVDDNYFLHQFSGLTVETNVSSENVSYGIGTWATAQTSVEGGKVDGQFVTVKGVGDGVNAQLIGQEIDVINNRDPETEEKYSTVGAQFVTIGTANSTAAIELISDWTSRWNHGIMIDEGAISEEGTVLACGQTDPMKIGIDFSNSTFTDSAILLNNEQYIKFIGNEWDNSPGLIYMNNADQMVIQCGEGGLCIKTHDGQDGIIINEKGELVTSNLTANNATVPNYMIGIVIILATVSAILCYMLISQRKRIRMIEDLISGGTE